MSLNLALTVGHALRVARQRAGLTQQEVARAIGLNPLAYGRLERGKLLPSLTTLVRLSRVLHTPTDVLVGLALGTPWEPSGAR
jgi:transcriptional regulator with XRE-family HTH domain